MDGPIPRGICHDMCPNKERAMRERENLLHFFEMVPGTERNRRPQAKRGCVVKEYTRPAAGKEDSRLQDLRPSGVLLKTVKYLINSIVTRRDRSWNFVYDFVFDRLRAVRKDMVIQRMSGKEATEILEIIVRFHIYAGYRLCVEPMSVFDPKINDTHAQECLKRLLVIYNSEAACRGNMGELLSIYVLYNLGQTEALQHALMSKHLLRHDQNFKKALDASLSSLSGNYTRVFKLCKTMPPINQCAVHFHLARIQSEALDVMSSGYHSKGLRFDVSDLVRILAYTHSTEAISACSLRGLNVNDKGILFNKSSHTGVDKVVAKRHGFIDDSLHNVQPSTLLLSADPTLLADMMGQVRL